MGKTNAMKGDVLCYATIIRFSILKLLGGQGL
jgi:hypothetical protein